jgi:hypothetical protein
VIYSKILVIYVPTKTILAEISCIYDCTLKHQQKIMREPVTRMPIVVANKVFSGENCKNYAVKNQKTAQLKK